MVEHKIACLKAEEVVAVHERGVWKTAKLISRCAGGQQKGKWKIVSMNRENNEGNGDQGGFLIRYGVIGEFHKVAKYSWIYTPSRWEW